MSRVPHRQEIESTWEYTSLKESKEKTGDEKVSIVFDEPLSNRDGSKHEDTKAEENMRWELFQNQVAGNLIGGLC